jgi:hypothetical protein
MIWILLAAAAAAAPGQPADTPRAFIQKIYAGYANKNYNPLSHADRIFAPRLVAAFNEDSRLAKGEVGYLDGDPLCDCQDFVKIGAQVRSLSQPSKQSALATVHVTYGTGEARDLKLKLQRTSRGWRVADIGTKEEPSLLSAIEKANREARHRH